MTIYPILTILTAKLKLFLLLLQTLGLYKYDTLPEAFVPKWVNLLVGNTSTRPGEVNVFYKFRRVI